MTFTRFIITLILLFSGKILASSYSECMTYSPGPSCNTAQGAPSGASTAPAINQTQSTNSAPSATDGLSEAEQGEIGKNADSPSQKILQEIEQKVNEAANVGNGSNYFKALVGKLPPEQKEYFNQWKLCSKALSGAANLCLAGRSMSIETANMVGQALMAIGSQATNDSCSKTSGLLDNAKLGLTGYTAACEAGKKTCDSACTKAYENIGKFQGSIKQISSQVEANPCLLPTGEPDPACLRAKEELVRLLPELSKSLEKEKDPENVASIAKKKKICEIDFTKMLMSAGASLASIMQTMGKSDKCDKDSAAEKPPGDKPIVNLNNEVDCNKTENAQAPKCLCLKNPRMAGCPGILTTTGNPSGLSTNTFGSTSAGSFGSLGPSIADGVDGGGPSGKPGSGVDGGAGGAMPGASVGGLSGSGGSGGGSGGKGGEAAAKGGRSISTDIISGEWGGSGGGGRYGKSSPQELQKAYNDYQKAQADKLAGQGALSQQLSSAGGKSNFEKVKINYNNNQRTLRP